jgi:hypothetical protein
MQHRSTQKEAVLAPVTRLPLDGGGCILVEEPADVLEGPVKAGRLNEAIGELPRTLQEALAPVTEAARATLDQLRKARPDEIAVEFGVDLAAQAGAVITKSQASCHLKVIMSWKMKDDTGHPPHPDTGAG